MTNEEAIKILEGLAVPIHAEPAFDMAIEALKCMSLNADMVKADAMHKLFITGEMTMEDFRKMCGKESLTLAKDINVPSNYCEYCHEDADGYVKPIEKNGHAFIHFGMNGWVLLLKGGGWHGECKIRYCPMCGRELKHE